MITTKPTETLNLQYELPNRRNRQKGTKPSSP
jgi:hypothetical protein